MKRILLAAAGAGLAVAALAAPAPAGTPELIRISEAQARAAGIETVAVGAAGAATPMRLSGEVAVPNRLQTVVAAPFAGTVTAIAVDALDGVAAGAALLTLASPQWLEAQRDYVAISQQAELAGARQKRDEQLFADGLIAESRLIESRSAATVAAAALSEKRQTIRLAGGAAPAASARELAAGLTLRAPAAGTVVELAVKPGQRVDAGAPLLTLARAGTLWLELQATPAQAATIAQGDPVTVAGCAAGGTVKALGGPLSAANQTVPVRAEFSPAAASCLRPRQYLQAEVRPRHGAAAVLPAESRVRVQGVEWVFVQRPGGFVPTRADGPAPAPGTRIAVRGLVSLKAAWLGTGGGE